MAAPSESTPRFEGVVFGALVMLLGIALFLDRAGVVSWFGYASFWPFLIIAFGLVKLSKRRNNGRREGLGWVVFGVLLLLSETGVLRLRDSWPLLLVAIGIGLVFNEISRPRARAQERLE
jgi:hypothetical protein